MKLLQSWRAATLLLVVFGALALPNVSQAQGGQVLPPHAAFDGYRLLDFVVPVSSFNQTGNVDFSFYPQTPFQVLYYPNNPEVFEVKTGTPFFVPMWGIDDSAPILSWDGIFPSTHEEALINFFGEGNLGAQGFAIYVDGKKTALGPEYLIGPVNSGDPMPWGGTNVYMLCAVLTPMSKGPHTVRIVGGIYGPLVEYCLGQWSITYLEEDITYNIVVK